jgi:ubiquinone/menaquinone biosynthesis C-methylase UbiE
MSNLNIARILLRELAAAETAPRVPEPELLMDDPQQVEAFAAAGTEGGSLTPLYVFSSCQISEVIRPGDTVLDLACGPANQLAQVARLNPQSHFIGIDLSSGMLTQARALVARKGMVNVEFRQADITDLRFLADASVDAVMSTLSLHHLPDVASLERALREAARVLKPDGGLYLADLGHLRTEQSIADFAAQYADRQPEVFTLDYRNSMRAAFSLAELRAAARAFGRRAAVFSTFVVPYMVAIRSPVRRPFDPLLRQTFRGLISSLPQHQQRDLRNLRWFFRLGGLASPYLG